MFLRGYHLRGSKVLDDLSLEFRGDDSSSLNIVYLFGRNGSGKSYIMGSIARSWSGSVLSGGSLDLPYIADMLRIDYELGSEICGVHIRGGRLEKSSSLAKHSDISVGDSPHVKNGIVYYSCDRLGVTRSTVRGGTQLSDSVCFTFPVLYDLHMRDIRDSIIMIDDWDRGLDSESSRNFYTHLVRHTLSKGNQLILSSSTFPSDYIPSGSIIRLSLRTDPIQRSMSLMRDVISSTESGGRLIPGDRSTE